MPIIRLGFACPGLLAAGCSVSTQITPTGRSSSVKHSGHAEIKVFASDIETGQFISESGLAVDKSNHDDFTLLTVIHFMRTDLEKEEWLVCGYQGRSSSAGCGSSGR